jgi:hypothetical protein
MVRIFLEKGTTMKQCLLLGGFVVAALTLSVGTAGETLKSGIPVNGRTSPFDTLNLTGPDKDKSLCLV